VNAAGLSLDTIELFRAIFHRLDLDGDGTIDNQEMSMGLTKVHKRSAEEHGEEVEHLTQEQIASMIAEVDSDGDGAINFTEFMIFMANLEKGRRGGVEHVKHDDKGIKMTSEIQISTQHIDITPDASAQIEVVEYEL